MRIGILGPLEVVDDGRLVEVGGARLRALLILLALQAGRIVPAERLVDDLWEDRPPATAANALQSLISRLRTAIGRDRIESHATGYRLALPREAVDAHDFEARVTKAGFATDPADRSALLREALELWRGPALADVMGRPFADGPIARLEGLRRTALEDRIEADLTLGRYTELIPELQALTSTEPLWESLRGRLMRALYATGHQAEALAVYEDARRVLSEDLGLDPSPELESVHVAVLRQDPALLPAPRVRHDRPAPAMPPLHDPDAVRTAAEGLHAAGGDDRAGAPYSGDAPYPENGRSCRSSNLPARLTSFIGRDEDIKQVGKLLTTTRLVTLTGPGGAGKTRLSQECAEAQLGQMPDGVWFIELAPVTDPAEVAPAVLGTLGLREAALLGGPRPRVPASGLPQQTAGPAGVGEQLVRLAEALAGKRMLLLLDNCEHLIDAAARLVDRLLAHCPEVRILATSREPLNITGETLWPVEPLPLPPGNADAAGAVSYPAVRLLVDRAAAVRPGFTVTEENVAALVRICRALDGMPLAIELAAARLRALTPHQAAVRLDDRFRLLSAGSRTALPRHQTLRAVVEWSWDLLDDAERTMWRGLSVFPGGATLESVEAVCAGPGLPAADVLDVLTALVDKSLVVIGGSGARHHAAADEASPPAEGLAGDDAEPRYRMLETIRAYGQERLAEIGAEEQVRRAHAAHFLELAETADAALRGHDQLYWLHRLIDEHDNIHAALRWAIAAGDARLATRFCAALGWYWWLCGHHVESGDALSAVLAMPDLPRDQTTAVAAAVGALATLGSPRDVEETKSWFRLARDIHATLPGDEPSHIVLRIMNPLIEIMAADMDERALERSWPLLDDPDPWVRALIRFMRGQLAINLGVPAVAERDIAEAKAAFQAAGDRWGVSFALSSEGELLGWRGRHREAIALYEQSLGLVLELGITEDSVTHVHMKLAGQLALIGERERAEALLGRALRRSERLGSAEGMAAAHYQLGEIARHRGDLAEATRRLDRAVALVPDIAGPPQFAAMIMAGRALLDAELGDLDGARARATEALRLAVTTMDRPIIAQVLLAHTDLARREGAAERAAELLGLGHAMQGTRDLSLPDRLRLEPALRTTLGEEAFTAAYERGRAQTMDDLLAAFGMERPPPSTL